MEYKLLIVDDDLDTLKLVGTTLERQNFEILAAKDGVQALQMAREHKPDLIILDVMMPNMDGYEVTRQLRADPETSGIPIILFTAKAQVGDKVEGLDAGADDYLTKPTHPAELVARVRAVLKRPKSSTPSEEPAVVVSKTQNKVIGMLSSKGGLGVSTLAINMGVLLNQHLKKSVIIGEMRPGRGDISVYLGYPSFQGLSELLRRKTEEITRAEVEKTLVLHKPGVRLLLSSFNPLDTDLRGAADQMDMVVTRLSEIADYSILDLGVGLPASAQKALRHCDLIFVIVEANPHTIVQTQSLLSGLKEIGLPPERIKAVLLNRVRMEQVLSANDVQKMLGVDIAAMFTPAPELAHQAARANRTIVEMEPDSFITQQIYRLIGLLGEQEPS
jgi:pilus assembly protein CpaE